ncbi:hypothetical protein ACFPTX_20700 [Pseudomonas sp. GCM10022188]|uniref:hypothetical protein n=1 Tax=Pseudomonas TaxID=286 RepID=UPI001E5972DF|nr:hypothetical protein [Pseudomonas oryzagri]MCC6075410.1 hypothetical protein [Pseudomonas oryzagri]
MDALELETIVSRIDGYVDALSSITQCFRRYRACARTAKLDITRIDESVADLFSGYSSGFAEDFPDLDVPVYSFSKAVSVKNWVRRMHDELEKVLLPNEYKESIAEQEALKAINYNLAWQVMEMIRMASNDFEAEEVFKLSYKTSDSRNGLLFVIPTRLECLTLSFEAEEDV